MNSLKKIHSVLQESNFCGLESIYIAFLAIYGSKIKIDDNKQLIINRIKEIVDINKMKSNTIDDIFNYYYTNDNMIHIKEYAKFYNNKQLINYMVDIVKIDKNSTVLDCNVNINSLIENVKIKHNIDNSNLYGIQTDKIICDIINRNFKSENICSSNILSEDVPFSIKHFDFIFCMFPSGIHNIIHATCCNKIKKLKIRGTKMEALLLQYIMMSLNKNGSAVLVVPDMLLFSDSAQMIETRKYLLESFNVKKIIELDESILYTRGVKHSIIYFENNASQNNIMFSKMNKNMTETKLMDVSLNIIQSKDYSLWYKHYIVVEKPKDTIEYMKIEDIFDIHAEINTDKMKGKILALTKYYNDNSSVMVIDNINEQNNKNYMYFLKTKGTNISTNNDFIYYYLEHIINTSYQQFTKGKMNQFVLSSIQNYSLAIVSKEKQTTISNYILMSNNIINDNMKQIEHYKLLKKYVIETISQEYMIELDKISSITTTPTNNNMIGVVRNSLNVGNVYMVNKNDKLSSNSHHINITDNKYNIMYVYHMMKYMEDKIKEVSHITEQPNLNKSNLLALKIPSIDVSEQNNIISFCNNINKYILANDTIKSKNIFSILNKV